MNSERQFALRNWESANGTRKASLLRWLPLAREAAKGWAPHSELLGICQWKYVDHGRYAVMPVWSAIAKRSRKLTPPHQSGGALQWLRFEHEKGELLPPSATPPLRNCSRVRRNRGPEAFRGSNLLDFDSYVAIRQLMIIIRGEEVNYGKLC